MSEFTTPQAVLDRIRTIARPHLRTLYKELTEAFPDQPGIAFALALGFAASVMQDAADDPDATARAFNLLAQGKGYMLTKRGQ